MTINDFKFGRISIDGRNFDDDIILLPPDLKCPWWRKEGHVLYAADMVEVLRYGPEILVIGTGVSGHMDVPPGTISDLEAAGIKVQVMITDDACAQFNNLSGSGRKVAAALHLTC